jgi:hypothetical protein
VISGPLTRLASALRARPRASASGPYGYPEVGRSGLGNMFFPWARCFLWCKDQGLPMLAPIWFRLRVGPYLRRERDKRNYFRFFGSDGYITGVRQVRLLLTGERVPETSLRGAPPEKGVVIFKGLANLFQDIAGRHSDVAQELRRITKPQYLDASTCRRDFIGIHVRRGDFSLPRSAQMLHEGRWNYQIPVDWYLESLRELRREIPGIEALVFSDGTSDLGPLLREPRTAFYGGRHAITDMFSLSRARVIIASGSTFSMWASYLGQAPAIWFPGQRRQSLVSTPVPFALEPEWESGALPPSFAAAVQSRLSSPTFDGRAS